MNNNTAMFCDGMNMFNRIAASLGFGSGKNWAEQAYRTGELTAYEIMRIRNFHKLHTQVLQGNARNVSVCHEDIEDLKNFISLMDGSGAQNHNKKRPPRLPEGTFRSRPYIKEFYRDSNGYQFYFKFAVVWEENYVATGVDGMEEEGYFIHILDAPCLEYAKEDLHKFHIITNGDDDQYICWDQAIQEFDKANAVMFVWVNRYTELLSSLYQSGELDEWTLLGKADKKGILPWGTFRSDDDGEKEEEPHRLWHEEEELHRLCHEDPKEAFVPLPETIYITQKVYDQIMLRLGRKKPELGGMLGFHEDQTIISEFVFDSAAKVNSVEYNPNVDFLNDIIQGDWQKKGICLAGFVHSHPGAFNELSDADIEYATRIIDAFELPFLFMPIVTSSYEYRTSITGYIVTPFGKVQKCNIKRMEQQKVQGMSELNEEQVTRINAVFEQMESRYTSQTLDQNYTFARICKEINIPHMSECSIIGIGCGGSRGFYEDMARVGVRNFYLMDGDIATRSNIASQNGYISEVGMKKPELIKKRLLDINEAATVECFNHMLDDRFDDAYIEENIIRKIDRKNTIICAFTDDFYAQARVSRIALKYKIPFLSGEHHKNGNTSELIFWHPNVTKYSRREIARGRYDKYQSGYKNDVTSVGSPIFNTTRLNALCEKIAFGMLLFGKYPENAYCRFLYQRSDRNLIIIRQRSLLETGSSLSGLFPDDEAAYFDDVRWVKPEEIEDLKEVTREEDSIIMDTRAIFTGNEDGI